MLQYHLSMTLRCVSPNGNTHPEKEESSQKIHQTFTEAKSKACHKTTE